MTKQRRSKFPGYWKYLESSLKFPETIEYLNFCSFLTPFLSKIAVALFVKAIWNFIAISIKLIFSKREIYMPSKIFLKYFPYFFSLLNFLNHVPRLRVLHPPRYFFHFFHLHHHHLY